VAQLKLRCRSNVNDRALLESFVGVEVRELNSLGSLIHGTMFLSFSNCNPSDNIIESDSVELTNCQFHIFGILDN
jgi:hypothetical protein